MQFEWVNPESLIPNPWNTNHLTPEAELKLEISIARNDMFKPVLIRSLEDGTHQLLGGAHRAAAALRMGKPTIPAINLGVISDIKAKEISVIDNARYGYDDASALSALLEEIGSFSELASFMPFDVSQLDAMSAVRGVDIESIDLDNLDLDEESADPIETMTRAPKTHVVMRFKVPIDDQSVIESRIKRVISEQELSDSDSLVNAGDALVWLIRDHSLARS